MPAPVAVLLPFFKGDASTVQCAKQRLFQTFAPPLAFEALDKAVVLELSTASAAHLQLLFGSLSCGSQQIPLAGSSRVHCGNQNVAVPLKRA